MKSMSPGAATRIAGAYGMSGLRAGRVWISPIAGLVGDVLKAGRRSLISDAPSWFTAGEFRQGGGTRQIPPTRAKLSCGLGGLRSSLLVVFGLCSFRVGFFLVR